jgi:peptidoglycan/LPS O-acetylase OafA/YrhL
VGDVRAIKRVLLRVAILALCVTALVAIVAVLTARLDETEGRILLTHLVVAGYSLFALAAAAVAERRPLLARAGWVACALGLVLALISIWAAWNSDSHDLYRWTFILLAVAFTLAHVSLIESRRRDSDGPVVRSISSATIAAVALLGALIAIGIATIDSGSEGFFRLLGVVGVLDVLGTVVLPIARKIEQPSTPLDGR